DWQIDGNANPPDIPNYEHNHVLRSALNGTWGQNLDLTGLTTGDSLMVDLNDLAVPSNVLDINNCYVLAYVYRTDTYEVLQVIQEPLHP
ncbi:MAG TPA: Omp28-related outer membrane protein, partial [Flavobacteriales bacterium]|nr:Omp28-related outer membrane protein [Flavobacteriales bacterium]